MRVIKRRKLEEFFAASSQARKPLLNWFDKVKEARWRNIVEMRETFRHADEVLVKSGHSAVVFNIKGNNFRLVTAVHYEKTVRDQRGHDKIVEGKIYLFYFLTHAEYNKQTWKDQL